MRIPHETTGKSFRSALINVQSKLKNNTGMQIVRRRNEQLFGKLARELLSNML